MGATVTDAIADDERAPHGEAVVIEIHEAADIFPLDEESIPALADDIGKYGLQTPIERYQGKVIDGRRRLRACALAGVEPRFKDVSPADPVAYVLSLNLYRRHLTVSQIAMVGARVREWYEQQAKERQKEAGKKHGRGKEQLPQNSAGAIAKGDTRSLVGKAVGVSGFTIDCATKVLTDAVPELVKAVDDGRVTVSRAAKLADQPREVQIHEATVADGYRLPKPRAVDRPKSAEETAPAPVSTEDVERAQKQRGKALEIANDAINSLMKIRRDNPGRAEAFRMVRKWMRVNS